MDLEEIMCVPLNFLPKFVAFKILSAERIDNLTKPGTKNNILVLQFATFIKLQIYADSTYQRFTAAMVKAFNDDIKSGNKWYVIRISSDGDKFIAAKLMTEEEVNHNKFQIFDAKIHALF
ncbi:uncharacterized protein LOC113210167 isoform X1 [Frankliniella occidentalis]|uniref:Uncharacterized protein LOC113210167 isoform X1 n=1 Tax=Frankliniella occidentalis TaxID=133901 RepID=A0A9C6X1Z4_FRAOC|nr:uncharacterized protein LOC113210167 isoform X1 [Frankliniella occidentalis]